MQMPEVFEFIEQHSLLHNLNTNNRAVLLLAADQARATELLVAHYEAVPPSSVVPGVLEAMEVRAGGSQGRC